MELLSFLVTVDAKVRAERKRQLRALLIEGAHKTFRQTFRHNYDAAWGAAVVRYHKHVVDEEREARTLLTNIRRTPGKVREAARRRDRTRVASPAMFELMCVARGTDAQMKEYSLLEAGLGSSRRLGAFRHFIVAQFGEVPARNPDHPPPRGTWTYRRIVNDVRVLTENELVALMVCLDPKSVSLTTDDLHYEPDQCLKVVLDRERRAMKDARRQVQETSGSAPRSAAERLAESRKHPILPGTECFAVPPKSFVTPDE